jgi:hypothetical protein
VAETHDPDSNSEPLAYANASLVPPPQILSYGVVTGAVHLNFAAVPAYIYTAQYSESLGTSAQWIDLPDPVSNEGGSVAPTTIIDTTPSASVRFYRLTRTDRWSGRPYIRTQPANQVVTRGASANFSVDLFGSYPMAYQWLFNSATLGGATSSTLALPSAELANAGNYQVIITNQYGSVTSAVATLTVLKSTPVLSWTNPATITYGAALSTNQLNAACTVPGSFAYVPANGAALNAGTPRLRLHGVCMGLRFCAKWFLETRPAARPRRKGSAHSANRVGGGSERRSIGFYRDVDLLFQPFQAGLNWTNNGGGQRCRRGFGGKGSDTEQDAGEARENRIRFHPPHRASC